MQFFFAAIFIPMRMYYLLLWSRCYYYHNDLRMRITPHTASTRTTDTITPLSSPFFCSFYFRCDEVLYTIIIVIRTTIPPHTNSALFFLIITPRFYKALCIIISITIIMTTPIPPYTYISLLLSLL